LTTYFHHPLTTISNAVIEKMENNTTSFGLFLVSGSALIAECCATHGIDWLVIDMEASPASRETMVQCLQALNGSAVAGLVRVATHERQLIEAALDSGAKGIVIPKVDTSSQARHIVESSYYPPLGSRGLNPIRCSAYFSNLETYIPNANKNTMCIVQIETAMGVENCHEIAAIDGIDCLFIGCGDLSMSLGCTGDMSNPAMRAAMQRVLEACTVHKKMPGIFAYSKELALEYKKMGFKFVAIGNDIKFMNMGISSGVDSFRSH